MRALQGQQISDGGWGWFSGYGERSWPHTTAVVVHGLQIAKANDIDLSAYAHLNAGQKRMNLGNKLRGMMREAGRDVGFSKGDRAP